MHELIRFVREEMQQTSLETGHGFPWFSIWFVPLLQEMEAYRLYTVVPRLVSTTQGWKELKRRDIHSHLTVT